MASLEKRDGKLEVCHKGGSSEDFIRDFQVQKKDQNPEKSRRKDAASYIVKKVLAAWEDSSSKPEKNKEYGYDFMMEKDDKKITFGCLFSLMETTKGKEEN